MSDWLHNFDDSIPDDVLDEIIGPVAEEFAEAWGNDGSPDIRERLVQVDAKHQMALLRWLVAEDLEHQKPLPSADHYCSLLPGSEALINALFEQVYNDRAAPPDEFTFCERVECPECNSDVHLSDLLGQEAECRDCGSTFAIDRRRKQPDRDYPAQYGRFQLLKELGRGGCGVVYKAFDTDLKQKRALKVIRKELLNEETEERFRREAETLAKADRHEHILKIYDYETDNGNPYIVTEFVDGQTLQQTIATGSKAADGDRVHYETESAARITTKIARALHYIHELGIVHRDVKPGNIMFKADGTPILMDFGLAHYVDQTAITLTGQRPGTPLYMAPEQLRGTFDRRSDIFSLGVVLFELLTGGRPFQGRGRALEEQILSDEAPSPRDRNEHVRLDLETICLKCLEKERAARYQTAKELADDLDRYLRKEPIHARPVSRLTHAWRWCRRNWIIAGLTSAILLLLTLVAGMSLVLVSIRMEQDNLNKLKEWDARLLVIDRRFADVSVDPFDKLASWEMSVDSSKDYDEFADIAHELSSRINDFLASPNIRVPAIQVLKKFGNTSINATDLLGTHSDPESQQKVLRFLRIAGVALDALEPVEDDYERLTAASNIENAIEKLESNRIPESQD